MSLHSWYANGFDVQTCFELWDICSDGIFTLDVYRQHEKRWVGQMLIPLLVCFTVACLASFLTLTQKLLLLAQKLRRRLRLVNSSSKISQDMETLEERLEGNRLSIHKLYCLLLLAIAEGKRCNF